MQITSTILTVGTALRHAQSDDLPVHVLCGNSWLTGRVIGLDGEGVALYTPDDETLIIRIAGISVVRIKGGAVESHDANGRPRYDGLKFPTMSGVSDLTDLGLSTTSPPRREPEPEPVISPYPVGHPARSGR